MIPICKIDFTGTGTNWTECHPKNLEQLEMNGVYAAYTEQGSLASIHPSIQLNSVPLDFYDSQASPDVSNIWKYRNGGLTGSVGIETGIPFQIWDNAILVFDGVLDVANAEIWEPDHVRCNFRQNISLDMLYNIMGSINFPLLRAYNCNAGKSADGRTITAGQLLMGSPLTTTAVYQYKITAYTIIYENEVLHAISTILHMIHMIDTFWNAIVTLVYDIANLAADIIDSPFNTAAAIADALSLITQVLDVTIITYELIGNMQILYNQLGLIGKYKYCMVETDIIFAILTYINQQNGNTNFTFSSTIYGVGGRGVFRDPKNGVAPYANYPLGQTTDLTQAVTWMPQKRLLVNNFTGGPLSVIINNLVTASSHPPGDETDPHALGPPYGCPDGNVKAWIQIILTRFNAVLKIIPLANSNDIQLEDQQYWSKQTPVNVTLDNTDKEGANMATLPTPSDTNYKEATFDYMLIFKTDNKEASTWLRYNGTSCNALIQPKIINNYKYVINPGGKIIEIQHARANQKAWLSLFDQAINIIADFLVPVFDTLNILTLGALPWAQPPKLNSNYPYLELSGDTFSEPKAFIGYAQGAPPAFFNTTLNDNGFYSRANQGAPNPQGKCWQPTGQQAGQPGVSNYPDPNGDSIGPYENYMSADCLMRLFHSNNWIVPEGNGYGGGNQYDRYVNKRIKMSRVDFLTILQNGNVILWIDGTTPCIIENITWKLYEETALITYRIKNTYTKNLSLSINIDGTNV
jgi:hypothetical protein